jgi:hypothetical protein
VVHALRFEIFLQDYTIEERRDKMTDSVKCLGFAELLKQAKTTDQIHDLWEKYAKQGISEVPQKIMELMEGQWVSVDVLKQWQDRLKEEALEIDKPSNDYGEVCKQNRQYRSLLKDVLGLQESPDSLSPEEIRDVEASEKEIASGKCKTFETAEDLIADLHKKEKGSLQEKKGCE